MLWIGQSAGKESKLVMLEHDSPSSTEGLIVNTIFKQTGVGSQ